MGIVRTAGKRFIYPDEDECSMEDNLLYLGDLVREVRAANRGRVIVVEVREATAEEYDPNAAAEGR